MLILNTVVGTPPESLVKTYLIPATRGLANHLKTTGNFITNIYYRIHHFPGKSGNPVIQN